MKNVSKSLLILLATTSLSAFAAEKTPVSQNLPAAEEPTVEQPEVPEVEVPAEEPVILENLTFEGARWGGKAAGYVCAAAETVFVAEPTEYTDLNVKWGNVVTDFSLDNGLLLATFSADEETTCSYSALVFADDTAKTIELVQSRAFPSIGEGSCVAGKAVLDAALAKNKYLWTERRKHLTIVAPSASAEEICGKGVTTVGIDFVFTGKIN
ncbi:MAG: hypothetical protein EOP07_07640 [Proteobacteria bacterium]|nr:MAG: hypothetical protein EOP07_07640 [Pseudomonadota bacterium]